MANSRSTLHLDTRLFADMPADRIGDKGEIRQVDATVIALIPEYHQAKVRDAEGHIYVLTRKTRGIDLASLHEGQHLVCTVTSERPRVLTATEIA